MSFVGSQVSAVALPLVAALTLDVGAAGVGAVATAAMLPNLLFSLLIGDWVEGRNHRRIMIPADLVRAALVAVIPAAWLLGWLSIPLLVAVAFLAGTAGVFFEIAGFAYVPRLVTTDELGAANRAVQGSSTAAQVAGPGAAGLLVQALGAPLAIVVDAVSYLASAIGILAGHPRTPEPDPEDDAGLSRRQRLLHGLRLLLTNPYLRALTVHAAAYNLASQILTLNLVLWMVKARDVSPGAYGLALSAGGVGALLGTLWALRLTDRLGFGRAFAASLLLSCFVPLLLAPLPLRGVELAVAVAAILLVSGAGLGSANIYSVTLRQIVIPPKQLARSVGAYRQIMYGSIPIGAALAGVLGETLGTQTAVALGTLGLALSALPMLRRRIRALPTPQAAGSTAQPTSHP
jgi:MFS family permease